MRTRNVLVIALMDRSKVTARMSLAPTASNIIQVVTFDLSINAITNTFRVLIFVIPPLSYVVTKRICLGLQRRDRDLVLHGRETGRIVRLPHGEMVEVHEPISDAQKWQLTQHTVPRPAELGPSTDANGVPRRRLLASKVRARVSRFYFEDRVEPPTPGEVRELESSGHH